MFKQFLVIIFTCCIAFGSVIDDYIQNSFTPLQAEEYEYVDRLLISNEMKEEFIIEFLNNGNNSDIALNAKVLEAARLAKLTYTDLPAIGSFDHIKEILVNLYYSKLSAYYNIPRNELVRQIETNAELLEHIHVYATGVIVTNNNVEAEIGNVIDIFASSRK